MNVKERKRRINDVKQGKSSLNEWLDAGDTSACWLNALCRWSLSKNLWNPNLDSDSCELTGRKDNWWQTRFSCHSFLKWSKTHPCVSFTLAAVSEGFCTFVLLYIIEPPSFTSFPNPRTIRCLPLFKVSQFLLLYRCRIPPYPIK